MATVECAVSECEEATAAAVAMAVEVVGGAIGSWAIRHMPLTREQLTKRFSQVS